MHRHARAGRAFAAKNYGLGDWDEGVVRTLTPNLLVAVSRTFSRLLTHIVVAPNFSGAHSGIGIQVPFMKALELDCAGGVDALANRSGRFAGIFTRQSMRSSSGLER
jgi:hypothetical protein